MSTPDPVIIEVPIKVKHLRNNREYSDPQQCPLALAVKDKIELNPTMFFRVGITFVNANGYLWTIDGRYNRADYDRDYKLAGKRKRDNTVIKTIKLIRNG